MRAVRQDFADDVTKDTGRHFQHSPYGHAIIALVFVGFFHVEEVLLILYRRRIFNTAAWGFRCWWGAGRMRLFRAGLRLRWRFGLIFITRKV